jgi:flagellar biosynthesis/type III secretory pathway protein FliH
MTLARARIIKGAFASADPNATRPPTPTVTSLPMGRRIARDVMAAHDEAERIREAARQDAGRIADEARAQAREDEIARLAATFLALKKADEDRAERDLERTVEIAKILAERLVGEGLAIEPGRIAALAANALTETRGARSVRIDAHPDDVASLREALTAVGHSATVNADATLSRGSLVVHTDLGSIDAQLRPQLDRLAKALREAMR